MTKPCSILISLAALFFISHAAFAEISGPPRIIDGDTVAIGGERIRLHGIDAPEHKQTCSVEGIEWACGRAATVALTEMIGSYLVICKGNKRDRYKRLIAVCYAGSVNLNARMVREARAPNSLASLQYQWVGLLLSKGRSLRSGLGRCFAQMGCSPSVSVQLSRHTDRGNRIPASG